MGANRAFRALLAPHIQFFRFIPSIAWLTPFVIWFGIGETPKVLLIFYTTVFIVALASSAGVGHIPQNMLRAGRALGASERQLLLHVTLPAVVPHILSGMRFAMGPAFTTVVAAEMIAANAGLGQMIENSRVFLQTGRIFVAMIVLGVLGLVTDTVFRILIRKFAGQYGPVD
jgi:NitT/TauT family transport system permease protein